MASRQRMTDPPKTTLFLHATRAERLHFLSALRRFRDEKVYRSLNHHIPLHYVEQGILPPKWTDAGPCTYVPMKDVLANLNINPDNHEHGKMHQNKEDRRQGKPEERTSMVKLAQLHHFYHGQQGPDHVRRMLLESRQGPAVDAHVAMNTERIADQKHNNVSMMISQCGLAIVIWMLEQPRFLATKQGVLTPFSTLADWQNYFYNVLKKYPMLIIVWLHKICPGLDLPFIYRGHVYDQQRRGYDLNDLKTKMRGAFSVRLLYVLSYIFQAMLNVQEINGAFNFRPPRASTWAFHNNKTRPFNIPFNEKSESNEDSESDGESDDDSDNDEGVLASYPSPEKKRKSSKRPPPHPKKAKHSSGRPSS